MLADLALTEWGVVSKIRHDLTSSRPAFFIHRIDLQRGIATNRPQIARHMAQTFCRQPLHYHS